MTGTAPGRQARDRILLLQSEHFCALQRKRTGSNAYKLLPCRAPVSTGK